MTYRDRRLARAERLRGWAEKREARSAAAFKAAKTIADGIPFGQPILIGHHSEKRARRDQEKIHNGMRAGCDHADKAVSMAGKADEIERQADNAIYSDDVDAIDRLQDKIAGLEAERTRIKEVNRLVRKHGLIGAADQLTEAERTELIKLAHIQAYYHPETKGFPPYVLTNLGGNISRLKKRLEYLSGGPAKSATACRPGGRSGCVCASCRRDGNRTRRIARRRGDDYPQPAREAPAARVECVWQPRRMAAHADTCRREFLPRRVFLLGRSHKRN